MRLILINYFSVISSSRPIAKGEEITITYGPVAGEEPYSKRQERFNHYLFACKCKHCLASVRQGTNLRCRSCSGPVPYNSIINKEPRLSGKCVLCFAKYEHFEQTKKQLAHAKQNIKSLGYLSSLLEDAALLDMAIVLAKKVTDLSLSTSEPIAECLLICSRIVQRLSQLFEVTYSLRDKVELAIFFHNHLPMDVSDEMLNVEM